MKLQLISSKRIQHLREEVNVSGEKLSADDAKYLVSVLDKLAGEVIVWAETPGDHGGNPYTKKFVQVAQKVRGDV